MSKNYEKVKRFYRLGLWNESMVKDAVVKHWITEDEFKEITGQEYKEG